MFAGLNGLGRQPLGGSCGFLQQSCGLGCGDWRHCVREKKNLACGTVRGVACITMALTLR